MDKAECLDRLRAILAQETKILRSSQVVALAEVLCDEANRLEERIRDLERFLNFNNE